jgi:hypothetical protein
LIELDEKLFPLKEKAIIEVFWDREIRAGSEWHPQNRNDSKMPK